LISSTFIIAGISCKNNHFFHSPYTFRAESKTARQFRAATKKGDSEESPSLSSLTGDYLFASAFSQHDFSQQALVESAFSAQHAAVESHFSAQFAQAEASVAAAAAAPSAAFLFELPQQLTIATAAMTTTKEKIFFISVKGLIISYSVTSQRYIFVRILQIKISDIFKACVCCWQAGA
jgi:hypothetical protein